MTSITKYFEILRTSMRSKLVYRAELFLSNLFLVTVMYIFVQLWQTTFNSSSSSVISGYSLREMIWYLVATEAIVLSLPRVHFVIEEEVKEGDLALKLNKPYSYLLFHYSTCMGEAFIRLISTFTVGSLTAYFLIGSISFDWFTLPILILIYFLTQTLNFLYAASIGLAAFWTEDISGLFFVFDRMKWILGGFLLPIEVFPETLKPWVTRLPFQSMIYGPAKLFVHFSWDFLFNLVLTQFFWGAALAAFCLGLFNLGMRKVDINGG